MSKKKSNNVRLYLQIFFFVLIAMISINHTLREQGKSIPILSSASLHAVCPFGGVVSIYEYFVSGRFVKKIHESSWILMWIVFTLTLAFGPVFCGWVCPFGSFQEWVGKIGKKIFKKRYNRFIPYGFDKWLRYLRYLVLVWVLFITAISGKIIFSDYDPYVALFNFWSEEVTIAGIVILFIVIAATLFVERPFCKYACPYGATLGIFNLFRIFGIKRNTETCIDCGACDRSCPMNIPVATSGTVRNHQCITCMQCTSGQACPVDDTVELMNGKMEVA
ncbi:4Fe-4S binding protein [Thermodesulfobacteriota bacterium]